MSAPRVQSPVLGGNTLVVGPDLDDLITLARTLGADGPLFHQLDRGAVPRLLQSRGGPTSTPLLLVDTGTLNDLGVAARTWPFRTRPTILVQADVRPVDLIMAQCPPFLRPAMAKQQVIHLVLDGVARELGALTWRRSGGDGFVRTDGRHARLSLANGLAVAIREAWYADGGPEAENDDAAVAYWSQVFQAPPALCRTALLLLSAGEGR